MFKWFSTIFSLGAPEVSNYFPVHEFFPCAEASVAKLNYLFMFFHTPPQVAMKRANRSGNAKI